MERVGYVYKSVCIYPSILYFNYYLAIVKQQLLVLRANNHNANTSDSNYKCGMMCVNQILTSPATITVNIVIVSFSDLSNKIGRFDCNS